MRKLRQSERTELSDRRMIETAIRIMLHRGISGMRLTDVGLQAGYSRGLATMRFGTMGGLLRRVAEHLVHRWVRALTEAVGQKQGLAAIYAAIDTEARYIAPPATSVHAQYLLLFHSMDPGAEHRLNSARALAAQRRDLARWLREAMKAGEIVTGVDPEAEAASILSSMIGIIFQSLIDPELSSKKMCAKLKGDIAERLSLLPRPGSLRKMQSKPRSGVQVGTDERGSSILHKQRIAS